jgi:hypothetical protein
MTRDNIGKLWVLVVEIAVAGSAATGIWLLGERLIVHGDIFWGGLLNYVADCVYFSTIPLAVLKIWQRPKPIWIGYGAGCLILAGVFVWTSRPIASNNAQTKSPEIRFGIVSSESPASLLLLTNDFLVFNELGNISNSNVLGCVVIPVNPSHSNIVLNFLISNGEGFSKYESAREVRCAVFLESNISGSQYVWGTEWEAVQEYDGRHPGFRFPRPILSGDNIGLPNIFVLPAFANIRGPKGEIRNPDTFLVWVRGENVPMFRVAFALSFLASSEAKPPFVDKRIFAGEKDGRFRFLYHNPTP